MGPVWWHAVVNGARPRWNVIIGRSICSQDSPRQAELWFDRKPVQAVGHVSDVPHHVTGLSPLPCALASSSPIASSSNRAYLPVWPLTCCSWPSPRSVRTCWGSWPETPGDWKWWRMGCLFSEEPNWLWTPPWSAFFGEMGLREQGQREGTVLRWQLQDVQKSGVTLNWWGDARGRGWLCWLWRWGDDGHQKHRSFCPSWREPEHVLKRRWHGGYVCWRAQWRGQWPHRFWNFRRPQEPTVRHLRFMRSRGIWQVSSGDGQSA